jgi:hypothetical protein
MRHRILLVTATTLLVPGLLTAETCTTQSRLSAADRSAIAQSAQSIARAVQSNAASTLRAESDADIQKNFGELQYLVAVTAPKLAGAAPEVEQVYLLDASSLKPAADGSLPEAQFFCPLNGSSNEADFDIPSLPAGRYAFAMVTFASRPVPWRISLLLGEQQGRWLLTGFYPKPLAIAGHDGLWYWTQARQYANQKQLWDAWLFYQTAMSLLQPAGFVLSTHLDKLHGEQAAATPPALSDGISPQTPLALRAKQALANRQSGAPMPKTPAPNQPPAASEDFRFTGLSLGEPASASATPVLDVQFSADPLSDPAASRERNVEAARTLLDAYPELRKPFTDVSITAISSGVPPVSTTVPISSIP